MQDRGDKIVTLAREILRADSLPDLLAASPKRMTVSFKSLFLFSLLTAAGASTVTFWAADTQRPLNHYERTELDALVFYTAHQKNVGEDSVRTELLAKLKANSFNQLTERQFSEARRYLHSRLD